MRLKKLEITNEARWFTYHTDPDDENDKIKFLIGCSSSPEYRKLQRQIATKRYRRSGDQDRFNSGIQINNKDMEAMMLTLGVHLLRGWSGLEMTKRELNALMEITDQDESNLDLEKTDQSVIESNLDLDKVVTVEYRPDIARAILGHPHHGDILAFVTEKGGELSAHIKDETEDIVGNSKPSSSSS